MKDMPCRCSDCPSPTHVGRVLLGKVNGESVGVAQCSVTVGTAATTFVEVDDARLCKIAICPSCFEARI